MTRSDQQRKAIEVYCRELGEALNDGGFDMKIVFAVKTVDIPWNQERVKDLIWRQIQQAMFGKKSTTQLEKTEVSEIYEVVNRHIAENFGVHVEFPSEERVEKTT
jgi:hypothetical protein